MKGCLIGDPVSFSISDKVYPNLFRDFSINGTFEKIMVPSSQLKAFFQKIKDFDFITVTMPHKMAVFDFCDELSEDAKSIGRVNYLSHINGKLKGYNFDGIGALNVIEEKLPVFKKKVVIVGAGGAARAAIFEAKKRGALIVCVNRTEEKGRAAANFFNIAFEKEIPHSFDILINATSVGMNPEDKKSIIPKNTLLKDKIVLDMASRNGLCLLKQQTVQQGGIYIPGSEMFIALSNSALANHIKLLKSNTL